MGSRGRGGGREGKRRVAIGGVSEGRWLKRRRKRSIAGGGGEEEGLCVRKGIKGGKEKGRIGGGKSE